ncbi:MAG: Eco57I restriction-modification methylase domain-containing protein [Candidatus Marinimicrobia bacterium]|nr:Eco57I restriction-modification methylase domain-containing protein [Candidatus Neomarinimicrobiota bacterium]
MNEAVSDAIKVLTEIEQVETADVLTVKDKETRWQTEVYNRLKSYRTVADLWISSFFGLEISDFDYQHLARQIVNNPKPRTKKGKELKKELEPHLKILAITKSKRPFHWELEFPEVFFNEDGYPQRNAGFDAVMGNPPYIRIQTMKKLVSQEVDFYRKYFITTSKGNYDIYIIFVEQGLRLLNKKGEFGFILPNKFFNTKYGEPLREIISIGKHISHIINFGSEQVFQGATTYSCLLFLSKKSKSSFTFKKVTDLIQWSAENNSRKTGSIPYKFVTASSWNFAEPDSLNLMEKLRDGNPLLEEVSERIFQGFKTGADSVFIINNQNDDTYFSKHLGMSVNIESNFLHPLSKSGNFKRYKIIPNEKMIIFPYKKGTIINWDEIKSDAPLTAKYLLQCKSVLESREKGRWKGNYWYCYSRTQALTVMSKIKILTADLNPYANYCYDETGKVCFTGGAAGGYGIVLTESIRKYVLGLLNSRLLDWFLQQISSPFRGGWFSYESKYISKIPIHKINFSDPVDKSRHDRLVELVDHMLDLNKKLPDAEMADEIEALELQIKSADKQIDRIVYDLYDLTEEEIKIIKSKN